MTHDNSLLRHYGYFSESVGGLDIRVPTSEGIHYIIFNLAGFGVVCNIRVFIECEVEIH